MLSYIFRKIPRGVSFLNWVLNIGGPYWAITLVLLALGSTQIILTPQITQELGLVVLAVLSGIILNLLSMCILIGRDTYLRRHQPYLFE